MITWKLEHNDVIEWAKGYTGEPFMAMFCDPPYHLTSITKRFGQVGSTPAKGGVYKRASKGFMGTVWDGGDISFRPETWEALGQHLYPGAFGLAFASPRNQHRMVCAIEDAGFIIQPTIYGLCYLSGFPKATRIDTQLDKAAGNTRPDKLKGGHIGMGKSAGDGDNENELQNRVPHVVGKGNHTNGTPIDPLAQTWAGHRYGGQALKPMIEPLILFGKSKDTCYNILQGQLIETNNHLEELWEMYASSAEEISRAAREVNTVLSNALKATDPNYRANGLNVSSVARSSTKPLESSGTTAESVGDTAPANATYNTGPNLPQENVSNAERDLDLGTQVGKGNIAAANVLMPPANSPCWLTPSEMGIDTSTTMDILRCNSEKARLDLSTIWLWKLSLVDLCDQANRSTTATAEKMITQLGILNYLLQKLTPYSPATQLKKSLSSELSLYARDAAQAFIGLLMFPKEPAPTAQNALSPLICFQKPYEGRPIDNIAETGAGALNIDGGRIKTGEITGWAVQPSRGYNGFDYDNTPRPVDGRWPGNLYLHHSPICNGECHLDCPVRLFDEQSGNHTGGSSKTGNEPSELTKNTYGKRNPVAFAGYEDDGPASRMLFRADWSYEVAEQLAAAESLRYEPKASVTEREAGLDELPTRIRHRVNSGGLENEPRFAPKEAKNHHPTVKSISVCKYFAGLLLPPAAYAPRRILVPFSGVASEAIGCVLAGWESVTGIESNAAYVEIARARLAWWSQWPGWGQTDVDAILAAAKEVDTGQMSLFSDEVARRGQAA